tara:strand:- start:96 stop:1142 length:1047 start_codon:yes stop_codon:yes gene_type:complete
MKKKSLSAKKIIHKSLLNHLKNKKISKVYRYFKKYLDDNCDKKSKICVAISGGPDSLSLAFLTKCYAMKNKLEAKFFIVDHGLRKNSSKEAKSVKILLKKYGINSKVLIWRGKKPKSNIQGIARNNRYDLLKKTCEKNNINNLLIGHHIDDLYENFFIRLLRGSGLRGLASFGEPIKEIEKNIIILRPLIKFEKKELIYISKSVFNFFVEDPSNQNVLFQRTRVRKLISELNEEGFDKKKLYLTIKNLKSANNAVNYYAEKNIEKNSKFFAKKKIFVLNSSFFDQPDEVVLRSISVILRKVSMRYYSPRGKSILNLIFKIKSDNLKKTNIGSCYIEKINKTFVISKEN